MWQPIETAPKDGKLVLLWEPEYYQGKGGHELGLYRDGKWRSLRAFILNPSHWMPLPEPPKE